MISVVIPAKNEEKNIALCLDALTKVEYPRDRLEIILVDNGSDDATVEVASAYGLRVLHRPGLKISELRNTGVKSATGEYIAFIDADIVADRDWLREGHRILSKNADICCLGGYIDIPCDASWIVKTWHLRLEFWPKEREVEWVSSMNMIVKKTAFEQASGFNSELVTAEDVDFCFRMKNFGRIFYSQKVRVVHLGEAKTLGHFFRKESWRGQSNFSGLFSHGIHLSELPSIILPLFFLYFYVVYCPLWLLLNINIVSWLHLLLFAGIPLLRSFYICFGLQRPGSLLPLALLWWLYYTARGFALIKSTKRRW